MSSTTWPVKLSHFLFGGETTSSKGCRQASSNFSRDAQPGDNDALQLLLLAIRLASVTCHDVTFSCHFDEEAGLGFSKVVLRACILRIFPEIQSSAPLGLPQQRFGRKVEIDGVSAIFHQSSGSDSSRATVQTAFSQLTLGTDPDQQDTRNTIQPTIIDLQGSAISLEFCFDPATLIPSRLDITAPFLHVTLSAPQLDALFCLLECIIDLDTPFLPFSLSLDTLSVSLESESSSRLDITLDKIAASHCTCEVGDARAFEVLRNSHTRRILFFGPHENSLASFEPYSTTSTSNTSRLTDSLLRSTWDAEAGDLPFLW